MSLDVSYLGENTSVRVLLPNMNQTGNDGKYQLSFSQKFLRSILILRENVQYLTFSQKFLREYLRFKSVLTLRQF